ncbi:hypothetical protein K503DRAFT_801560 [Rhizopogon vinicolor AM-OR11-026]|uniref:DUF6533 domain-containing protein n=1 Tax=Rhizopogon vinicolor AM-OR11-026 TaxID=1314800 RepID=A0A1B7MWP8_9AGAM|nr:hypothetical protein K503DRAFT_801560 [Rhizopogon vinicolor AM-OR11-026]
MTVVSNDPSWWPMIGFAREYTYFSVAVLVIVIYDWVLTFGQEVELIWRQRWSLMTVAYLAVGALRWNIIFCLHRAVKSPISLVDRCRVSEIIYCKLDADGIIAVTAVSLEYGFLLTNLMSAVADSLLGVIVVTRLYAMYQQSRKMLIFLIAIYVIILAAGNVIFAIQVRNTSAVEYVLSGAHICLYDEGDSLFSYGMDWILRLVWEILVICLAVWIAVKHFRELQRPSTGWAVGDCFTVLIKTHLFYFASFIAVSCLEFIYAYTQLSAVPSMESDAFIGGLCIVRVVQSFVLGPRLILGVREYHAKLVGRSDEGTDMISIAFQERIHITTGISV